MKPKITIERAQLSKDADTQKFCTAFERCNRLEIPEKMWNKMYAIMCKARDNSEGKLNYKIYRGARYEYDVTTRSSWPLVRDECMCIANIMEGKKNAVKN